MLGSSLFVFFLCFNLFLFVLFVVCFVLSYCKFFSVFLDYFMCLFVINAWLDLFVLCLFACFCLFGHMFCLFV